MTVDQRRLDLTHIASSSAALASRDREFFAENGFLNLGVRLDDDDLQKFVAMFDSDGERFPYFWHPYGHHQYANYDALITSPEFDGLIRHPNVLPTIEALMGGPVCFGEIGLRLMHPYQGSEHRSWHRDRAQWTEHPLHTDYLQLIVYLTDVDDTTHCLSLSPQSIQEEVLRDPKEQVARGGIVDCLGPAGTCFLFNVAVLHTATTRPTTRQRKSVQIYYGHRHRAPLANDSAIPATFWRDSQDEETRGFYGVINDRTRLFRDAFPSLDGRDEGSDPDKR